MASVVGIGLKKGALDVQPDSASQVFGIDGCGICEFDEGVVRQVAGVNIAAAGAFEKRPGEFVGHVDHIVGQFHFCVLFVLRFRFFNSIRTHVQYVWRKAKSITSWIQRSFELLLHDKDVGFGRPDKGAATTA